jgi:hypothetical protein
MLRHSVIWRLRDTTTPAVRRQRRARLEHDVRRGIVHHAVRAAAAFELDGLRERPAPDRVDKAGRHHVEMDVD